MENLRFNSQKENDRFSHRKKDYIKLHILLRIDQYEDYVVALSKSVSFLPFRREQHLYRVFPWTIDFNSREETSMATVWISLPRLSPDLFAKRSLLSMASAVGRPITIDKAT
ncbi:hypothetical protein H5410_013186 [Solanum commersonii]|uniref:DUF4283 domain-containing protein n=1 Tax=Solanum commersonii TaxID=4109 RepID=A0A9J6ATU9_SOLCO|nr:hypothetical protein H5410_013186 [Solanum commersonii]